MRCKSIPVPGVQNYGFSKNMLIHKLEDQYFIKRKLLFAVVLTFVFTAILEVWLANSLVTNGSKLEQIKESMSVLQMENRVLGNEVAKKASLPQVQSFASALGFGNIQSILYLSPQPSKSLTSNAH